MYNYREDYGQHYMGSYDKKKGYAPSKGAPGEFKAREVAGNYYQSSGKQGKNFAGKDIKGGSYSSGGSSGGSTKGGYHGGYAYEHSYYHQHSMEPGNMKSMQSKYKKTPGYYSGDKYGSHFGEKANAASNEAIPQHYIDGDSVTIPIFQPLMFFQEK
mmetsp:Transcript_46072/g.33848  ORF Transcript_46072/g.33848 Transcript_46072/m.33848 type:complete len:157 (+) Transcript_46072:259-729(+)